MDLKKLVAVIYLAGSIILSVGAGLYSPPAGLIVFGGVVVVSAVWWFKESE